MKILKNIRVYNLSFEIQGKGEKFSLPVADFTEGKNDRYDHSLTDSSNFKSPGLEGDLRNSSSIISGLYKKNCQEMVMRGTFLNFKTLLGNCE